jgi:hypothetical protein
MILAFGPVTFESRFDAALEDGPMRRLFRAAAPPATRRYGPWPGAAHRHLRVSIGPTGGPTDSPRYVEDGGALGFRARGAAAILTRDACSLRLDPSLQPGERVDQTTLVLAAAGVAAMLEEGLGVVFHASTSAQDGRAWTFPAPHATGKSTVADRLDPDLKIADDLTALVRGPAVPWLAGGTNATGTGTLPLGGLLFLRRAVKTELGPPLGPAEALRHAIRNAVLFPGSPTLSARLMDRLTHLVEEAPCRILDFSLDDLDRPLFRRLACPTT